MGKDSEGGGRKRSNSGEYEQPNSSQKRTKGDLEIVVWRCDSINLAKTNPIIVAQEIQKFVESVEKVVPLFDGGIQIHCAKDQAKQLARAKKFQGVELRTKRVGKDVSAKGIIHGVGSDLSDQSILANVKTQNGIKISDVKRLGGVKKTESVVLTFVGEIMPERVYIGFNCYTVKLFIPRPIRCYKCQRFGHIATSCNGNKRCPSCGENHDYEECSKHEDPVCCNCGGKHSAAFTQCPKFTEAREIMVVKVQNKLSYSEAVKEVRSKIDISEAPSQSTSTDSEKGNTDKVYVDIQSLAELMIRLWFYATSDRFKGQTMSNIVHILTREIETIVGKELNAEQIFKKLPTNMKVKDTTVHE